VVFLGVDYRPGCVSLGVAVFPGSSWVSFGIARVFLSWLLGIHGCLRGAPGFAPAGVSGSFQAVLRDPHRVFSISLGVSPNIPPVSSGVPRRPLGVVR
jgi:hypothetical protein